MPIKAYLFRPKYHTVCLDSLAIPLNLTARALDLKKGGLPTQPCGIVHLLHAYIRSRDARMDKKPPRPKVCLPFLITIIPPPTDKRSQLKYLAIDNTLPRITEAHPSDFVVRKRGLTSPLLSAEVCLHIPIP